MIMGGVTVNGRRSHHDGFRFGPWEAGTLTVEACTGASIMAAARATATSWLVILLPILAQLAWRQDFANGSGQ
jgi:hypothetical protein